MTARGSGLLMLLPSSSTRSGGNGKKKDYWGLTMDDEYPCDTCSRRDYCDGWDARFCCTLCQWYGMTDCDNCDPMDI